MSATTGRKESSLGGNPARLAGDNGVAAQAGQYAVGVGDFGHLGAGRGADGSGVVPIGRLASSVRLHDVRVFQIRN